MSKKTWLAFGCTHIPHHDKENAAWIIEQIRERQPELIICLGDLFDCASISDYPKVDITALAREYEQADEFIDLVNQAAPKARKVFMEGNHEERVSRPGQDNLADLIHYKRHIKSLKRWKVYEYLLDPKSTFTSGQLTAAHGWAYTVSGVPETKEGIDLSEGCMYGLYIHAHTHRPVGPTQASLSTWQLPFWRLNVGTGVDFDWAKRRSYAKKRNISKWAHALAYGWHDTKRRFDGKRNWEAELIIRKGAWD